MQKLLRTSIALFGLFMACLLEAATYQASDYSSQSGCGFSTLHSGYTGSNYVDMGGNGTWIEWDNVNISGSGPTELTIRYANGDSTNRQCEVIVNGNSAGNVNLSPTGGWTTWIDQVVTVSLVSGDNTVRIMANTGNGGPNIDRIEDDAIADTTDPSVPTGLSSSNITASSVDLSWNASTDNVGVTGYKVYTNGSSPETVTGTMTTITGLSSNTNYTFTVTAFDESGNESDPSSGVNITTNLSSGVSQTYQAESYTAQSGSYVQTTHSGYTGSGYMDMGGNGSYVEWDDVDVGGTGTLTLTFRYANSDTNNRACDVIVNSTTVGSLSFAPTGSWSVWDTEEIEVSLGSGDNTIHLVATTGEGAPNLDKMDVDGELNGSGGDTTAPSIPVGLVYSNVTASSVDLSWSASTDAVGVTGYKVYIGGSNPIIVSGTSYTVTGLAASTSYTFTVSAFDAAGNESSQSSGVNVTTNSSGGGTTISEDFSGGASNFTVISGGIWSVIGQRYLLTDSESSGTAGVLGNISVHNTSLSGDYTLSTIVRLSESGSTWDDAAVVFGFQDANNYYYVSLNESNDGNTKGVFKVVNGAPTELADITASITSLTDYALSITRSGSSIVVSLDSIGIASTSDATFSGGQVGFGTYNDDAEFDNLIVTGEIDDVAPSTPTGLVYSNVTDTTVDLDWNASSDNVSVAGYLLYIGGSNPVVVSSNSITVTQLSPSTSYTFTVSAFDAAGNESSQSSGVNVTTSTPLAQVAAPQFSPEGGSYENTQTVSITTSTSGATIRFTTDGSTPTSSFGTVYSGSITVSSTSTIRAIAYKSGMSNSDVTSEHYTIGAPLYGARGAWPSNTPDPDSSPTTTVSSFSALQNALRTANSGDVIHLTSFNHTSSFSFNDATAKANLATLTENVLVRPAPGATVTLNASVFTFIPNVTWAYFKQNSAFLIRWGSDGGRLARIQMGPQATLHVTGVKDYEFVECLKPVRGLGGDTMALGPHDGQAPEDILWDSCWLEGMDVTPGDHSDTMQWLGSAGVMKFRNSYIGPAGNNSSLQMGAELQPSGVPYAVFDMDTMFLGGSVFAVNNGNVLGNSHRPAIYRRVEWPQVRSRPTSLWPTVLEDCRFQPANPTLNDGTPVKDIYPDNEFGVPVPFPTFVEPEWWD